MCCSLPHAFVCTMLIMIAVSRLLLLLFAALIFHHNSFSPTAHFYVTIGAVLGLVSFSPLHTRCAICLLRGRAIISRRERRKRREEETRRSDISIAHHAAQQTINMNCDRLRDATHIRGNAECREGRGGRKNELMGLGDYIVVCLMSAIDVASTQHGSGGFQRLTDG